MNRARPLVWGEGAEQLNKYLKDLREATGLCPPPPSQHTDLVTVSLYIKIYMFRKSYEPARTAGVGRWS